MTDPIEELRMTVIGCTTATPDPAAPAAGYLIRWGETALLLDVGQGVIRHLQTILDPHQLAAVIVGHMHADHYLDLAGLRYTYPWGEPAATKLALHLPPGGRRRLDALAEAISERPGFFDAAYDAVEYDPAQPMRIGPLVVRFIQAQHYVPAWGLSIDAPDGARLVYTGDTGPNETMVDFARGADLLLVEAALRSPADDDPRRGHLTPEEAIDLAVRAEVGEALIVHYAPDRRAEIDALCEPVGPWIRAAMAGMTRTVLPATVDRDPARHTR